MAKIICTNAGEMNASDFNSLLPSYVPLFICQEDCPTCHGAGYTEAEVVEVDRIMWLLQESTMWENSPAPGKYRRIDMEVFNKLLESLKEAK